MRSRDWKKRKIFQLLHTPHIGKMRDQRLQYVRCLAQMSYTHWEDDAECPVLLSGEKVCKWVRLILHVALFACQNLSLIVRGHCLHKADAVPKDMFRLVREWSGDRSIVKCPWNQTHHILHVTAAVTVLQIAYLVLDLRLGQKCQKYFAMTLNFYDKINNKVKVWDKNLICFCFFWMSLTLKNSASLLHQDCNEDLIYSVLII